MDDPKTQPHWPTHTHLLPRLINIDFPGLDASLNDIAAVGTAAQATAQKQPCFLNTKPGKTEATLDRASPAARRRRNEPHSLGNVLLPPPPQISRHPTPFSASPTATDLGNLITTPSNISHKAHDRAAQARAAFGDIPTTITWALSAPKLSSLLTSLTTTRLHYAREVWVSPIYRHAEAMVPRPSRHVCEGLRPHLQAPSAKPHRRPLEPGSTRTQHPRALAALRYLLHLMNKAS